ncbi:MAG: O-antigen ligase family protein [Leptospirales bacterium]|nr:O-antigen ligase family protein [Leptospirales bacterium]
MLAAATIARRTSDFGGGLAIITYPISVSLSQFGLMLALVAWLVEALLQRRIPAGGRSDLAEKPPAAAWRSALLATGAAIYSFELLSLMVNSLLAENSLDFFLRGAGTEFKDFWLMGMALWVIDRGLRRDGLRRIESWLQVSVWILVITGFVSIFSKYRLSKIPYHLMHGWAPSAAARYQHLQATLFPDSAAWHGDLFMPIGFQNTHLTFAAMLCLAIPWLLMRCLDPLLIEKRPPWKSILLRAAPLPAAILVLALNNGRSALIGLVVVLAMMILFYGAARWKTRSWRLLPALVLAAATIALLDRSSGAFHDRFARVLDALNGHAKHTDSQRTLVWNGALRLSAAHPVFGIGPGAFEDAIRQDILSYGARFPRLWPDYELAQRGHAHNDILHLLTIAGPGAVLAYLAMFGVLAWLALRDPGGQYNRFAPLILLFAGLFQCYFQDDETLMAFWIYAGLSCVQDRLAGRQAAQ